MTSNAFNGFYLQNLSGKTESKTIMNCVEYILCKINNNKDFNLDIFDNDNKLLGPLIRRNGNKISIYNTLTTDENTLLNNEIIIDISSYNLKPDSVIKVLINKQSSYIMEILVDDNPIIQKEILRLNTEIKANNTKSILVCITRYTPNWSMFLGNKIKISGKDITENDVQILVFSNTNIVVNDFNIALSYGVIALFLSIIILIVKYRNLNTDILSYSYVTRLSTFLFFVFFISGIFSLFFSFLIKYKDLNENDQNIIIITMSIILVFTLIFLIYQIYNRILTFSFITLYVMIIGSCSGVISFIKISRNYFNLCGCYDNCKIDY